MIITDLPLNSPKAILFARTDTMKNEYFLDNRKWSLIRYAYEHGYYNVYNSFTIGPRKDVEEKFIPFLANELLPALEKRADLAPLYPVYLILCYSFELVPRTRRAIVYKKLRDLGVIVFHTQD